MSQVVLVTGGSRGIGRAISRAFHEAGCAVAINYVRDRASAEQLAAELGPDRAMAVQADVTDQGAVDTAVEEVEARFGPVGVLVNNAGVWAGGPVEEVDIDSFRRVLEVSVVGTRNCVRAVLGSMKTQRHGSIVTISSSVALMGWRGDTAYAAAKSALIGFTRSLAREAAPYGVTANTVVPGLVDTDMTAGIPASERQRLLDRTLLGRSARPEEVASLVRFVALEGSYLTGSVLVADGGLALGAPT